MVYCVSVDYKILRVLMDLVVRAVSRTEWSGCFNGLGGLDISVD